MSSACLVLNQSAYGAVQWPCPPTASRSSDTNSSQHSLWRPWVTSKDGPKRWSKRACPYTRPTTQGCFSSDVKPQAFQHPVRLFWPKSKSFDYLYSDGEVLLRNFPVQATISFYDESGSESESEEEDWDDDDDSEQCLKQQSHFTSYN